MKNKIYTDKKGAPLVCGDIILVEYKDIKYLAVICRNKKGVLYPHQIDECIKIDKSFPVYNSAITKIGFLGNAIKYLIKNKNIGISE